MFEQVDLRCFWFVDVGVVFQWCLIIGWCFCQTCLNQYWCWLLCYTLGWLLLYEIDQYQFPRRSSAGPSITMCHAVAVPEIASSLVGRRVRHHCAPWEWADLQIIEACWMCWLKDIGSGWWSQSRCWSTGSVCSFLGFCLPLSSGWGYSLVEAQ